MKVSEIIKIPHPYGEFSVMLNRGRVYAVTHQGEETIWRPQEVSDWNIGGDRLWIAPERDWHWTDVSVFDLSNYKVAEAIDPGSWRMAERRGDNITVELPFTVQHRHNENFITGKISRQFTFHESLGRAIPGLQDPVSWKTVDTLTVEDGTPGQGINLWRILQVPVGGQMYVSFSTPGSYRLHFGDATGLVKTGRGWLEAEITGHQMYKIGVMQQGVKDLIAYARPLPTNSRLVTARWFDAPADAMYLDTPMDESMTPGDVLQIYNDDGFFGGFGELEVHGSGVKVPMGATEMKMPQVSDTLVTMIGTLSPSDWTDWKASNSGS